MEKKMENDIDTREYMGFIGDIHIYIYVYNIITYTYKENKMENYYSTLRLYGG